MSLYLGKFGRKILNFTVTHPRVDRFVDHLSNAAHRILGDRFTPRLTRDMFLLYQNISKMEEAGSIEIRKDGFYVGDEKLAPNSICDILFRATIQLDSYTPESLVKYIREFKDLVLHYRQRFGDPWQYSNFSALP